MKGNAYFLIQNNFAKNGSIVVYIQKELKIFHRGIFKVVSNFALKNSSIITVAGVVTSSSENASIIVENNAAEQKSNIIVFEHPVKPAMQDVSYFREHIYGVRSIPTPPIVNTTLDLNPDHFKEEEINGSPRTFSFHIFSFWGKFVFHANRITEISTGITWSAGYTANLGGSHNFTDNVCQQSSHMMYLRSAHLNIQGGSHVMITHNDIHRDSFIFISLQGSFISSPGSKLTVTENAAKNGFSFLFIYSSVISNGSVSVSENNISSFGALHFINSVALIGSSFEVIGNRAESGGITLDHSDLNISGEVKFIDNQSSNGGGLTLISSVMRISPNSNITFARNYAENLGGAIFILNPRSNYVCGIFRNTATSCSIQVISDPNEQSCELFSLTFNHNRAGIAGNAIYGGRTSGCMPSNTEYYCSSCPFPTTSEFFHYNGVNDSSDLSAFTFDPTRVCFCENGIPNCYKSTAAVSVNPGENFHLSLAVVGYGLGTVPGSVVARNYTIKKQVPGENIFGSDLQYSQEIRGRDCQNLWYSVISERDREQIVLAVNTQSFSRSIEEVGTVVNFQLTRDINYLLRSPYDSAYENFFHIPVFVEVELLPCPVGFQLVRGRCICHQTLLDNGIDSCHISNGSAVITRPFPYWIGLPNNTNSSIILHPHCPFDYCQSHDVNISVEHPHSQCQNGRSEILCGSCREGQSMVLGSSQCKICSNFYLMSISILILLGIALVGLLTALNMTVSVGTLNGLILFANILQANRTTFLPTSTGLLNTLTLILSAFISWLNLDVGIPMCFFDGLTTYAKTWLQFVFPLYIMGIVGCIIIASKYSSRVTNLFGNNTISVLATLVLLSYTKILRIVITVFAFTTLTGSNGYHKVVWLADGNISYFEPKHTIAFIVALLVLLFLGIPYTLMLTAAPWLQKSNFKFISSVYNRFKPLFDAYMGPYKDNCRYWTGMLLIARVVLIVVFSSISNTNTAAGPKLNLLLLTLSSSALLTLTAGLKPYKNTLLNNLEVVHFAILFLFSASNLYAAKVGAGTGWQIYIYVTFIGIVFIIFLGICVGHVWWRLRGRKKKIPGTLEREREDYRPKWQKARVMVCDEEDPRRDTTTTADMTTYSSGNGENSDSNFRESVLELS